MTNTRRNVWELGGDWADPILWYARGVKAMKAKNVDVLNMRTGWRFYGAMHDFIDSVWQQVGYYTPGETTPSNADRAMFWRECQHGTWYFLPWHRGYLMGFEAVVRAAIVELNGPNDWALPYWNYFKPNQNGLPPAFATPDWPDGTGDNPLYVTQRYGPDDPDATGGGKVYVPMDATDLDAMDDPDFVSPFQHSDQGFGGIKTGFLNRGRQHGGIESHPHDDVHGLVGGGERHDPPGLMSSPITAGLDPIFWLHHANIDRLWEVWVRSATATGDPKDAQWLKGPASIGDRSFVVPMPGGVPWTYTPEDVHVLSKLDYTYDDLSPSVAVPLQQVRLRALGVAPAAAAAAVAATRGAAIMAAPNRTVELMGANAGSLRVTGAAASTSIALDQGVRNRVAASLVAAKETARPDRVFLNLENIKAKNDGITFSVYIGLPEGADPAKHPECKAGNVTLFGASEAARAGGEHAGDGLTHVLEISDIVDRLHAADALKAGTLSISVVPRHSVPESAGLSIGRISLYRQSG
jgi:tyrosinase